MMQPTASRGLRSTRATARHLEISDGGTSNVSEPESLRKTHLTCEEVRITDPLPKYTVPVKLVPNLRGLDVQSTCRRWQILERVCLARYAIQWFMRPGLRSKRMAARRGTPCRQGWVLIQQVDRWGGCPNQSFVISVGFACLPDRCLHARTRDPARPGHSSRAPGRHRFSHRGRRP